VRQGWELGGGGYYKSASIRRGSGGRVLFAKIAYLSPQPLDLDREPLIGVSIVCIGTMVFTCYAP
jgi:hypothetical protein